MDVLALLLAAPWSFAGEWVLGSVESAQSVKLGKSFFPKNRFSKLLRITNFF